jgi:hypothetical protein
VGLSLALQPSLKISLDCGVNFLLGIIILSEKLLVTQEFCFADLPVKFVEKRSSDD